jgi:hypothetical protein
MEDTTDPLRVYPELFTVDYQNMKHEGEIEVLDRHLIDQSFTFLHWNLAE